MKFSEIYRRGFKDGFRAAQEMVPATPPEPAPSDTVTEVPDLGAGMPSDEDMLLYATPFFEPETEKKAAQDDAADEDGEK